MTTLDESVATTSWGGEEYELRATFAVIRGLRARGVNFPKLYDEGVKLLAQDEFHHMRDDIVEFAWALMASNGVPITLEELWAEAKKDDDVLRNVYGVFWWFSRQYYASSEALKKPSPAKRKAPAKRKTKPSSRKST